MFDSLEQLPADPILGLLALYQADSNPNKVDLGVGVYKNEAGDTPILASVKLSEARRLENEESKAYIGPAGEPEFNASIERLLYGKGHKVLSEGRLSTVQTPGGCGALRVGAELVMRANPDAVIWVSDPTWANHIPLMGEAGLTIKKYPYYNRAERVLVFDAMMSTLEGVGTGELVLLHGCCHNPCGADLSEEQWRAVTALARRNGFVPFIDIAYQGFGRGIEEDAYGVRYMAEHLPELIVTSSCSKNFGLYRDRAGALSVLSGDKTQADATRSQIFNVTRGIYSMPPAHGPAIVRGILTDVELRLRWEAELADMRDRMRELRHLLVDKLTKKSGSNEFGHIREQFGMFSFLGISKEQVQRLRDEYSVYMVDSSRINVAGISQANIEYLTDAIVAVLKG